MSHRSLTRASLAHARGFSLIELMVAVVLGIIVTLGVITVFTGSQETLTSVRGQARVQENARYALDFISRSARMTGYLGCASTKVDIFNALAVADTAIPFAFRINEPIFAFQSTVPAAPSAGTDAAAVDANWSPALNLANSGLAASPISAATRATIRPGTDVLVLRSASSEALQFSAAQGAANANIVVRTPTNLARYANGTVVLASDCNKATIFQITTGTVAGPAFTVQHHVGGPAPGNSGEVISPNGDSIFDLDSSLYRISSEVFFVALAASDEPLKVPRFRKWSLWRQSDTDAPVELVEGVHDLQVTFGLDLDNDSVPNVYETFQEITPAQRPNIVTIRVVVGTDSVDPVATTNGATAVLNRQFDATIAVRNRVL